MTNTQALIIAAGIVAASIVYGIAATITAPQAINGCVFNSSPPTLTDGQSAPFSCDSTGKLRVTTAF